MLLTLSRHDSTNISGKTCQKTDLMQNIVAIFFSQLDTIFNKKKSVFNSDFNQIQTLKNLCERITFASSLKVPDHVKLSIPLICSATHCPLRARAFE